MNTFAVAEVVKAVRDLPALPAVVMDLLCSLDQEDAGTRLLAEKLSHDQALAAHWKFPLPMQKAIADHHLVEGQVAGSLSLVAHFADAITHALDLSGLDDDMVPPVSGETASKLAMNRDAMTQIFRETESQFEEACQILVA